MHYPIPGLFEIADGYLSLESSPMYGITLNCPTINPAWDGTARKPIHARRPATHSLPVNPVPHGLRQAPSELVEFYHQQRTVADAKVEAQSLADGTKELRLIGPMLEKEWRTSRERRP
jgi:hypothetical protein